MDEDRSACDSYDEIDRYRAAVREEDGDDDDDDMPQDEAEWARGGDAPGGYPVSAAASTLGLDLAEEGDGETVGTTVAGAPEEEARGGGAWNLLEKAACFAASAEKRETTATARDETTRGTGTLGSPGIGTVGADRYAAMAGDDDVSRASSHRSGVGSYDGTAAEDGGGASSANNFPSTAARAGWDDDDDDDGCGGVVECITVAVASVCGFGGAGGSDGRSPARRRAHEIVERGNRRRSRAAGGRGLHSEDDDLDERFYEDADGHDEPEDTAIELQYHHDQDAGPELSPPLGTGVYGFCVRYTLV